MSNKQLSLAKLSRPRLHAPVARERLFKLLDEARGYPLVWVGGPAGCGKTTLVASYLESRRARVFWYLVDAGDRDPATLFHYLALHCHQASSRRRGDLPAFTADFLLDLPGFARRFFREFFLRLGSGAVLVLDNCQDSESESFHVILREASQQVPPECQLIALSRGTTPGALTRELTNQRLYSLSWPRLRLTDEEALAIAQTKVPDAEASGTLWNRRCDGWVGGLVLWLAHMDSDRDETATRAFESREALFNYFAEEVLLRAAPVTQQLLLRTSVLPFMTLPMAREISGDPACDQVLALLYSRQFFIDRKAEGELTYQYHDLFREFLLRRLLATTPAPALKRLRQRAARLLVDVGRPTDAVQLYKDAQDWLSVTQIIRANAPSVFRQGRWQTINAWFEGMAQATIDQDPWLMLWQASARCPVDSAWAYEAVQRAYASFRRTEDSAGELLAMELAVILTYNLGATFHVYDEWFARLEHLLPNLSESIPTEVGLHARSAYLIMNQIRIGHGKLVEEVIASLLKAFCANELDLVLQVDAGDTLLHQGIWPVNGDLAEPLIPKLHRLALSEGCPPEWRCNLIKDLGYWYFFNAQYAESLPYFEQAHALSDRYGMQAFAIYNQCYATMALCGMGRLEQAERSLHDIHAALGNDVFSHSAVNWTSSTLAAARGDFDTAFQRAHAASEQARAAGFTLLQIVTAMPAAAYALESGREEQARAMIAEIHALTQDTYWRFPNAWVAAMQAELQLRAGARPQALACLKQALALARNPRMAGFLVSLKRWLPRHLSMALAEGIEPDTARQLIQRFALKPYDLADLHWPWPVRVHTLGRFEVQLNGEPLRFPNKAPKKPLALLKALIAFGGRAVKLADLIDALWPDSESDAAHEALKVALVRLRKMLGGADILELQQNQLSLNTSKIWVDAQVFEQAADSARCETALSLYQGSFLPAEESAWPVVMRERLRRKYVQQVAAHARLAEQRGDHVAAEHAYLRGLDADNLVEQFYQGLMRAHLARAQRAEGMDVFRRLRQVLSVTLGVAPSAESERLFQALQNVPRSGTGAHA